MEIAPGGRSLAIADIVEEPLHIDLGILLQRTYHIVDTTLRDVLHESHACIALEGLADVGAVARGNSPRCNITITCCIFTKQALHDKKAQRTVDMVEIFFLEKRPFHRENKQ